MLHNYPANIYLFKINNRNTRKRFLLLTLNNFTPFSSVPIVDFEQVNVSRVKTELQVLHYLVELKILKKLLLG